MKHGRLFSRQTRRTRGKENTLGKVLFGLAVSLDGRAMERFHEVVGEGMNEAGAVIMGRRTFNQIDSERGWVMQSQSRAPEQKGHRHFSFVTDGIQSVVAKAQELAGEKDVALHGASSACGVPSK